MVWLVAVVFLVLGMGTVSAGCKVLKEQEEQSKLDLSQDNELEKVSPCTSFDKSVIEKVTDWTDDKKAWFKGKWAAIKKQLSTGPSPKHFRR